MAIHLTGGSINATFVRKFWVRKQILNCSPCCGKSECHFGGSEELKLENVCPQAAMCLRGDLILDSAATG